MNYEIVYNSRTGNTARLAMALKEEGFLTDYGRGDGACEGINLVFVGFWTDKGSCDEASAAYLRSLRNKQVFLFGTAGFGGSEEYFSQILSRVRECLHSSNTVAGSFMCQEKMPLSVRARYKAMEAQDPEKARALLDNFDLALSHPDETDLENLKKAVAACVQAEDKPRHENP